MLWKQFLYKSYVFREKGITCVLPPYVIRLEVYFLLIPIEQANLHSL